jgi:hypothetical protein
MWLTGLWLALGIATAPGSGRQPSAKPGPRLSAELFTRRWPMPCEGWPGTCEIEKPHLREKLRRLVQITSDDDPDKARFWFVLAEVETERWRAQQLRAGALPGRAGEAAAGAPRALERESRMLAGRAGRSWEDAVAAYASAAAFPTFEPRDGALYWLARLYLARDEE